MVGSAGQAETILHAIHAAAVPGWKLGHDDPATDATEQQPVRPRRTVWRAQPRLSEPVSHGWQLLGGLREGALGVCGAEAGPVQGPQRQPERQHPCSERRVPSLEQLHASGADEVVVAARIVVIWLLVPRLIDPEPATLGDAVIGGYRVQDHRVISKKRQTADLRTGEPAGQIDLIVEQRGLPGEGVTGG